MRIKINLKQPNLMLIACGHYSGKSFSDDRGHDDINHIVYAPSINADDKEYIEAQIEGSDLLYLVICIHDAHELETAIAILNVANQLDIDVLPIVQLPYPDDYPIYGENADKHLEILKKHANNYLIIQPPNDEYHRAKNLVVRYFPIPRLVKTITDSFNKPSDIGLSFKEVKEALLQPGITYVGEGEAIGDERAFIATMKAIEQFKKQRPNALESASSVLVNITGNIDMTDDEVIEVLNLIRDRKPAKPVLKSCAIKDFSIYRTLRVSIFCTGLEN